MFEVAITTATSFKILRFTIEGLNWPVRQSTFIYVALINAFSHDKGIGDIFFVPVQLLATGEIHQIKRSKIANLSQNRKAITIYNFPQKHSL